MELLAQIEPELDVFPVRGPGAWISLPFLIFSGAFSFLAFAYFAFWVWMLIQCIRSEPDKYFWLWLLIVVPFPGAIVYAALRYFPATDYPAPAFIRRWLRGTDLARLEAAAEQIGNPHQFIQWGDALRDVGRWDDAEYAYDCALKKDPENLQALWGAAVVAEKQGRTADVITLTRKVLAKDPQYKFGDVSLALGKALAAQGDAAAAREHLTTHIKRWRHPEGLYLLATLCNSAGQPEEARQHLRALLQDLNASPTAIARKHGRWKSRAKQLLRKMPSD